MILTGYSILIDNSAFDTAAIPIPRDYLWDREDRGLPTAAGVAEVIDGDLRECAVLISGPESMISDMTAELVAAGVPRGRIRSERQIGPPGRWKVASPALRWMRAAVTGFFGLFVLAVVVCTVSRAIFA